MNFMVYKYTHELLVDIASYLKSRTLIRPEIGIICGSGLGKLADSIENAECVPYKEIPNFPVSTVPGHEGKLVFGNMADVPVVAMQGRFHFYEGYPLWQCCLPVRVMKLIGVTNLLATNAAGGVNKALKVGDIMLVKDHINMLGFAGNNPLTGPNDDKFGPRFPPMNKAYDAEYIDIAKRVAEEMKIHGTVREGVYGCLGGPNYETVAELNMLAMVGVDAVGMSTVHEVITARHCGMKVFAMSLITNECNLTYDNTDETNHEEVLDVGKKRERVLGNYVERLVEEFVAQSEVKRRVFKVRQNKIDYFTNYIKI